MSQTSRINGFRPAKYLNGSPWNGASNVYFIPASNGTAVFTGDAVKLAGDARAATGVATVVPITAATDIPLGIVVGMLFSGMGDTTNMPPVNDLNTPIYRRPSTDRYVLVVDDPQVVYEVQFAGAGPAAAAVTANVGSNGQFLIAAGNTTTGASGYQIDSAGLATTSTLPLKIVGLPNRPDNIPGDPFISYWVKLNASNLATGLGSTGV